MIIDQIYTKKITTPKRQGKLLSESMLMEDPVYRNFKRIGRYIAERKMTEKEILQVFADAELGMTDKATGANRTMLGRGKDTTMDFASGVANALKGVWGGIQKSVPVEAVDQAWDAATNAMANLTGGQKGQVMQAIKKYRMLAKQYPKTAGLAKAALVGITGLVTGGAGLPAAVALIYGLDSAIKGEKFSDIALKAGGAAATAWAAGSIAGMFGADPAAGVEVGAQDSMGAGEEIVGPGATDAVPTTDAVSSRFDNIVSNAVDYKVKPGDTLSDILANKKINPEAFRRLPGNEVFFSADGNPNIIKAGQTIKLPDPADITDLNRMSYSTPDPANFARFDPNYDTTDTTGYTGQYNPNNSPYSLDATTNLKQQGAGRLGPDGGIAADRVAQDAGTRMPTDVSQAAADPSKYSAPIDYSQPGPTSTDSLGQKLEYGIPVNDKGSFIPPNAGLPADELARQTAAYDAWKADFTKRFPNAELQPDGSMKATKPGLAPMGPSNYTPGGAGGSIRPKGFAESVKLITLPASQLIDKKTTILNWTLNESIGRKSKTVNLTTAGTYTVFENVDRYRKAILEATQPGRPELPDLYRPDMAGAPVAPAAKKPGMLSRGLSKVGGALSTFGRQFTRNVTKEKLKMNWHQAGKPSDSDQLAAWLTKQGVPLEVVTSVYSKMGIPYTAPVAPVADPQTATSTTAKASEFERPINKRFINPATGRPYLPSELRAEREKEIADELSKAQQAAGDTAADKVPGDDVAGDTTADTAAAAPNPFGQMVKQMQNYGTSTGGRVTGTATGLKHTANPNNPNAVAATTTPAATSEPAATKTTPGTLPQSTTTTVGQPNKVTYGKGFEKFMKPKTATQFPAFGTAGTQSAYKTGISLPKPTVPSLTSAPAKVKPLATTTAAAPVTKVTSGPTTAAEKDKLAQRIAQAVKEPVAEMLQMVETKEDVQKIKQFVDRTFVRYGAINESAFVVRNQIIAHVTQVGAQRRREHARMS